MDLHNDNNDNNDNNDKRCSIVLKNFLHELPKVELHVHFDGSFDPSILHKYLKSEQAHKDFPGSQKSSTSSNLYVRNGEINPICNQQEFTKLCKCCNKHSFLEMVKCFKVFIPIVRGNMSLLEKLAYDFVKRQAKQNVIYTEVRYSPHLLAEGGSYDDDDDDDDDDDNDKDYDGSCCHNVEKKCDVMLEAELVVDAITKGLRLGEKDFGVKVNQILCCLSKRPEWIEDVIRIAHERKYDTPCAIVGIDVAAGEDHFNKGSFSYLYLPYLKAFRKARELKLNITLHAGEFGCASNIITALRHYGASRIGHGYCVINNKELVNLVKKSNTHFEVCPTSSVETNSWKSNSSCSSINVSNNKIQWRNHPIIEMVKNGLNIGFNTDNPAVFDINLTTELFIAAYDMDIGKEYIIKAMKNSIEAAFISTEDKINLKEQLEKFIIHQKKKTVC